MHEKTEFEQLNQHQVRPVEITSNPKKLDEIELKT